MAEDIEAIEPFMSIPSHMCEWPPLSDELSTATSELQTSVIEECLLHLTAVNNPTSNPFDFDEHGLRYLNRTAHLDFVHDGFRVLPPQFVAMDASRPWHLYWCLLSLYAMGESVKSYQRRLVKTLTPLRNRSGGFGGGQGHLSHLAPTYAVILAVAMVGGEDAYRLIDRGTMWHWLGRLKQADGSFRLFENGEIDVRGAYCALVAITLLNLPWELPNNAPARAHGMTDFRDNLGSYLSRCQTYEGGIAAAPSYEAHGAYAFCALGCLSILGPPHETIPKYLDLDALIRWLSARQYGPEGGFAGRTNKVVDGCYSHWIGGCWPLVEAAVNGPSTKDSSLRRPGTDRLFDNEALIRYILGCAQAPTGGLRDKPSKRPDQYHTCYNLAGLSMATHLHSYSDQPEANSGLLSWSSELANPFSSVSAEDAQDDGAGSDEVAAFQPVYVIPNSAVRGLSQWSRSHKVDFGMQSSQG